MIKRIFQSGVLIVGSLVVAVLLMEMLLQLFPSLLPVELHVVVTDRGVAHPEIGNLPAPNSAGVIWTRDFKVPHQIDQHGFRNNRPWPASTDVAVIGDSLVFGYGVELDDAWPQRLAKLTGKQVVNLGLIGAGPQQYASIYRNFAEDLNPGVLLIGFFASNEFWDTEMFERWTQSGVGGNYMEWRDFGRQTAVSLEKGSERFALFLRKYSHVANLVRFMMKSVRNRSSGGGEMLELANGGSLRLDLNYLDRIAANSQPGNEYFARAFEAMKEIHERAQAAGTRLVVVFQPSKEEIYFPFTGRVPLDPTTAIRERLEQLGIECLDLAPAFRAHAEAGEQLFFSIDGHPNAAGYRLIAEQTAAYLAQLAPEDKSVLGSVGERRKRPREVSFGHP